MTGALPGWLEASPVASGIVDATGRWVVTNAALRERFGTPPTSLLDLATDLDDVVLGHLGSDEEVVTIACDGLAAPPAEALAHRLDGEGLRLVLLIDRSEAVALDERLAEATLAFERFVSTVSHDLKNPLGTMLGFAELLGMTGVSDDEARDYTDRLLTSSRRVIERLEELVAEARSAAVQRSPNVADLDEVVAGAVAQLSDRIAEHGASVEVVGELPTLRIDAAMLRRVAVAVLDNALTHGGDHPTVRVSAVATVDGWELRFDDDGPGVEDDRLEGVFGSGVAEGPHAGRGLGLTVARSAVERRGGQMWLTRSELGGASVRVLLPHRRAADPSSS